MSKTNTADTITIIGGSASGYGIVASGGGGLGSGVSGTSGGILTSYPTSSTITLTKQNYTVFKLPIKDKLPNKVYVAGRLVTVGILGSDVQAAFTGDKLVFSPGELEVDRTTISLDYGDWLYHYNIEKNQWNVIVFEENSNIIKTKLMSRVAQR